MSSHAHTASLFCVIGYFGGHSVASKLTGETRVMLLSVMLNSTYCIQAMFMLPGIFLTEQRSYRSKYMTLEQKNTNWNIKSSHSL
ncbi:unnamed protein product [Sphagnum jensenii]